MLYKAAAPGSLMLMGEYAVLQGGSALVCAVDKRITVTLQPRVDQRIVIVSARLGHWETTLSQLSIVEPFRFVTACLYRYRKKLRVGCELTITADFSDQMGLGSSSAVTVATLAVLRAWLGASVSPLALLREGRQVIRVVQGVGSGADVAASVFGGVVAYRANPLEAEKLAVAPLLTVLYSGAKTPTVEAIRRVKEQFSLFPALFTKLCHAIELCVKEGKQALLQQDWPRLGKAMNIQQSLLQALGVSTPLLENLLNQLRAAPTITGAKISGSGFGDCVLGIGKANLSGVQQLELKVAEEGVISIAIE
jgi:mevalonate kinase